MAGYQNMAMELNVGVIGGGYAGMAAAVTLAAQGIPVTVYESAKQLGGRARGVDHHGIRLDNGQHILLGCYRHTLRLIEQVGGSVEHDFLRLPLQLTLYRRFELKTPALPAPLHLLAGLMTARGLTIRQRLSAASFMMALRAMQFKLPHDCTTLELLRTHNQDDELIRLLWEPICISALNTPVAKASAQVLLNVLRDSLNGTSADSEILLPRLDFSTLFPDRAAEYLKSHNGGVITSCRVDSIASINDTFELHTARGIQRHSHVVCATAPANASCLLRSLPQLEGFVAQIEALDFQPIYTVYLQYPPQVELPQEMLGFDRGMTQWVFDKGQLTGPKGLLAAVISAEGRHQEYSHEQLARKVILELQEQLGITESPTWHQVIAEKRATFSCEPDLDRPPHTTSVTNFFLAGDYTSGDYPATLEGAVMSGLRCAAEIIPAV